VQEAFLPLDQRVEILTQQKDIAAQILERETTRGEEAAYSLLYELEINTVFQHKEQPPAFISLTRQDLIQSIMGFRVRTKLTDEENAAGLLPMQIDLSEMTLEGTKAVYELVGTAHHLGSSNGSGHYIAKINRNGKSITADDSSISESSNPFFCRHGAVVYKRIS